MRLLNLIIKAIQIGYKLDKRKGQFLNFINNLFLIHIKINFGIVKLISILSNTQSIIF